ncbi:unnamed protein product [Urochloa humidicola]
MSARKPALQDRLTQHTHLNQQGREEQGGVPNKPKGLHEALRPKLQKAGVVERHGRPPKTRVDEGPAKVTEVEQGTAKVTGAANRKRNEPSRRTAATPPRTVLDEFSRESIANRITKRKKHPVKLLSSPYWPK